MSKKGVEGVKLDKETKKVMMLIIASVVLVLGIVFLMGKYTRYQEELEITSKINVTRIEEMGLEVYTPWNYTPITRVPIEIPSEEISKGVSEMKLDQEQVLDGYYIGDYEGFMIISIRPKQEDDFDKKELKSVLKDVEEVELPGNTEDKAYKGIREVEKGVFKVERYVRAIGKNEWVVDVEHTHEGHSFIDSKYILDSIRTY